MATRDDEPDPPGSDESPEGDALGGRLRRTAALGRLAATEAAKYAATSAANLGRTPDEAGRRARAPPGRGGAADRRACWAR